MTEVPSFYGYTKESVQEFLDNLRTHLLVEDIPVARWLRIFTIQRRGPARQEHQAALANGVALDVAVAAVPAPQDPNNAVHVRPRTLYLVGAPVPQRHPTTA